MATVRTVTFEYSETPDEVMALLQDPVYLRHRSEAAGERNIDVKVQPEGDGMRVTVARVKDLDVPAYVKKAIGDSYAVESTLWRRESNRWVAEYTIEASGIPVKAKGRSELAPGGRGCKYTSTFEITAKVPLIGAKLEAMAAEGFEEQLRLNAERNAAALARGTQRAPQSFIAGLRGDGARSNEG